MGSNTVIVDVPFRITNCHFKTRDCFLYGGLVCVNLSFARVRLKYGKTGQRKNGKCDNSRCSAAELRESGIAGNIFSIGTDWKQMKLPSFRCGFSGQRNCRKHFLEWNWLKADEISVVPLRNSGIAGQRNCGKHFIEWNILKANKISVVPLRNYGIAGNIFSSKLIESRWNFRCSTAELQDSGIVGNIFSSGTDWMQIKFPLFFKAIKISEVIESIWNIPCSLVVLWDWLIFEKKIIVDKKCTSCYEPHDLLCYICFLLYATVGIKIYMPEAKSQKGVPNCHMLHTNFFRWKQVKHWFVWVFASLWKFISHCKLFSVIWF